MLRVFVGGFLMMIASAGVHAQAVASVGAQQGSAEKISVAFDNTPLQDAVWAIAKKSGVRILFADDLLPAKKVSYHATGVTPAVALSAILIGTNIRANQTDNGGFELVRASNSKIARGQGIVTGKVTDGKTGRGVSGANISINGYEVVSGEDGSYRLTGVSAGTHIVLVRLVGYTKQTHSVIVGEGATVTVDFKLEPSTSVLDQVVVTGTVVQSELRSVPNAITVITAKQIEERGITRIDQLFRGDIPGLFSLNVGSQSGFDEVTMFSRGATALDFSSVGNSQLTNPIKTYIDGVEMMDAKYLSQIDPSSIERIEVLTGPQASTIYGSNAINGVMQIFTKRGKGSKPQVTLALTSGVTENNFSSHLALGHIMDAGLTGVEGRFSYNIGSSWNYAGSWTPSKQTQRFSSYGGSRMDFGKITADLSSRQGLTKTKSQGSSEAITALRASGIYLPLISQGLPRPQSQSLNGETFGLSFSYRPVSWWSHEILLGSDRSATELITTSPGFGSGGVDTTFQIQTSTTNRRSEAYNSTIQFPIASSTTINLTFGGDRWRTTGSSLFALPVSLTGNITNSSVSHSNPAKNSGMYVQGQVGFFDALFMTYGMRADWNPNFGKNAKVRPGRYGIAYSRDIGPVSAKIRGSYGRSIRPPGAGLALAISAASAGISSDVTTQFGNFDAFKGNPDLGPEHQSGGEGGVELYFGSRSSLVVTRFNQTVSNLISLVPRADSIRSLLPVFPSTTNCMSINGIFTFDADGHCFWYQQQYLNVGSIRNQGWEMQGSMSLGPLTTRGTYSWIKSRILGITPKYRALIAGTQFEPGRPFDFMPEHTWALGLSYVQSRSTVSVSVNGIGMRYIALDGVSLVTSGANRLQLTRPRMSLSNYRPVGSAYATADLNATHRFAARLDALLQINNLTNYYQNDLNAQFATQGRSSRAGFRLHL